MAITSVGENAALYAEPAVDISVEDKTALGKDDFMMLLLVQMQHQDPTEPMDSDKILSQTSQLATLEATENTNKALEELALSLSSSNQFSTISAIGKTADLGSNAIVHDEGSSSAFEVYFPSDIDYGAIQVVDSSGNLVKSINIEMDEDVDNLNSGVYKFDWDGTEDSGNVAESGIYYINASYTDPDGNDLETRLGAYPIESVRFDGGQTLVKVGSNYVPLENIKEVY